MHLASSLGRGRIMCGKVWRPRLDQVARPVRFKCNKGVQLESTEWVGDLAVSARRIRPLSGLISKGSELLGRKVVVGLGDEIESVGHCSAPSLSALRIQLPKDHGCDLN